MNLRWLKQNLIVIVFTVAFFVVLALIILMERKAAAQKDLVVEQLGQQQAELDRLRNLDPTPAGENIDVLRRDREQLQRLYLELQKGAVREPVRVPDLQRDVDFSQLMRVTVNRLTDAASASNKKVKLTDNFAFGFSRYDADFPCRHPAAKTEDCRKLLALLAKQVLVVEKLGNLLIESGVEEIKGVRRTEVEPGTASTDALPVPIGNDPKALYKTYPFELKFTCKTVALRNFLNGLTKSDWFFAVRSVRIETTAATGSAAAAPAPATEGGAAVEQRLLDVTARVDLIELSAPETPVQNKT